MRTPQLAASLSALLILTACGSASPSATPSAVTSSSAAVPSPTSAAPVEKVQVFLVADTSRGFRLFPEWRVAPAETTDFVAFAVAQLFSGGASISDPDFVSLWSDSKLNTVTISNGIATVDIAEVKLNVGSESEARAIDQLVWTITTQDPSVTSVAITVNGETVESLAGHVDATQPFVPGESYEVLSPVTIESINFGDTVSNPVVLTGMACTFEANVPYEVIKDGEIIQSGAVLASEACPTRSPYEIKLNELAAGTYTIRVFELSMEDGSLLAEDTKVVTVQ